MPSGIPIARDSKTAARVIAIESMVYCHIPSAPHASRSETERSAVRHWLVAKTAKAMSPTTPNHPIIGISELGAGTEIKFLMN